MTPSHLKGRCGFSLALVLPILAIVTILIVTALTLAMFDNRSAVSGLRLWESENMAKIAIADIAEKIVSIPLDTHWAASPGRIRYWDGSSWEAIQLYSEGNPSDQVDLNAPLADGRFPILPANMEFGNVPPLMPVSWIYIRQDGTRESSPAFDAANPVIGRFAYWADVENGRVNINTAGLGMTEFASNLATWNWSTWATNPNTVAITQSEYENRVWRNNPFLTDEVTVTALGALDFPSLDRDLAHGNILQNLVAHPSSIDLSFLESVTEQESFNTFRYAGSYFLRTDARNSYLRADGTDYITAAPDLSVRRFVTPADWRLVVGADTYEKNRAYITTRGRTPEITPWGTPKLNLSLLNDDANFLGVWTEDYQRQLHSWGTVPLFGDASFGLYYAQDTRAVTAPAIYSFINAGLPSNRASFRDLSGEIPSSANDPTIASLVTAIDRTMDVRFPGFSRSLAEKYDGLGGTNGSEQVAVELLTYSDAALNGFAPGWSFFASSRDDFVSGFDTTSNWPYKLYNGLWNLHGFGSNTRRIGSSGPFLVNELSMQADLTTWAGQQSVYALDPSRVGTLASPGAHLSNQGVQGHVLIFLTRQPNPGDVFIQISMDAEIATPARYGFATPIQDVGFFGLIPDIECTYSSTDPTASGGTLRFSGNQTVSSLIAPSSAFAFPYPRRGALMLFGLASNHPRPATGTSYTTMRRMQNSKLLVGPFAPDSSVSISLRPKFVFTTESYTQSDAPRSTTRLWTMVPGTFLDATAGSLASPLNENDYLEYDFPGLDTSFPFARRISFEVDDPRVARKASDWIVSDGGSLGVQNSNYTGGGGIDSDLAKPNTLLQSARSRIRAAANSSPVGQWASHQPRDEFQNASRILGLPGVGYLSSVPTGVDAGIPWLTMQFQPTSDDPPDWLMWSLLYVPFDRSIANQTDGKLNINATLHPFNITRQKPLEALLGNRLTNPASLASNIANRSVSGTLVGPADMFVYPGQLCQVNGITDGGTQEYDRERLARDLADIVTTQCDDYRVFAIGQSGRQQADGRFIPSATVRVEATVSRSADTGTDGYPLGIFTNPDTGGNASNQFLVHRRSTYAAEGNSASTFNVYATTERSAYGTDLLPNTGDDWLVPQRIDITSYSIQR